MQPPPPPPPPPQQRTHTQFPGTHTYTPSVPVFGELFRQVERRSVSFISSVNKSSCRRLQVCWQRALETLCVWSVVFACICVVYEREHTIRDGEKERKKRESYSWQVANETKAQHSASTHTHTLLKNASQQRQHLKVRSIWVTDMD